MTIQPFAKNLFSKNIKVNVKIVHTSGLGVCFFWYEVDYRSADVA